MIDIDFIQTRNKELLSKLIEKYNMNYTIEEFINDFTTIYLHVDNQLKRIRLMGAKKIYILFPQNEIDSDHDISLSKEVKRVQLYVLKKRDFEQLQDSDRNSIAYDLTFFIKLLKETQTIIDLKELEEEFIFMDYAKFI